jgi:hypothetical protein
MKTLREEAEFIKTAISPAVEKHYPSKANHEKMSLHDLVAFAVLAHRHFDGVYKRAHRVMVQDLGLFPQVRYNKVVERLHRYEDLLLECLSLFQQEGLRVVDSKPVETKNLVRYGRHRKRGASKLVREEEAVGFNSLKGGFSAGSR